MSTPLNLEAQTRSQITGQVTDSTGAVLPGVTVTSESPGLVGGAQTATTDERGMYRFFDLSPGTYSLNATLDGFAEVKRTGIRVLFGTTVTIDLAMSIGGTSETVQVIGGGSVDVTTAQATSRIDAALIQDTPTISDPRNGLELMAMSPGINARSAFGGARDANEVLFDGAPTTLPERQGANGAVINPSWMEEIQIVGLGASAEYGEFSGTVANFVTRSGSNDWKGLVEYHTSPGSWVSNNLGGLPAALQTRFTPADVRAQWDANAQVGGPVGIDRLFFFTGLQRTRQETQQAGSPAVSTQDHWRALGKLTWAASNTWKIDATVQMIDAKLQGGASATTTADVGMRNHDSSAVWAGRATWTPNAKTLVELRTGGLDYAQTIDPKVGGRSGPPSRMDVVTGIRSVNGNSYRASNQGRVSAGASVTRYSDNLLGSHQLKAGADVSRRTYDTESGFPSGLSFTDRNGVPDQVTIWQGDRQAASGTQATLYAQDSWKVTDQLTVEPGVRLTVNRGRTPTTGLVYRTTPLSPRIGAAWDVTSDHKTVVRAHYGRFHEAFGTVEYQFTDTAGQTPQITARMLGPNDYQELSRFTPAGNQFVDDGIKQPYMDQYLIGVERELVSDVSVNVQYVHRESNELFGWNDTQSIYAPATMRDPGPDGRASTADDGELVTVYNLTNPGHERRVFTNAEGAWRRYRAFQVIAQKRFSKNWQLLAGYTRSRAEGSVNNASGDNYGSTNAAQSPFINPNNAINATGRNSMDYPHEAVIRGSYRVNRFGGFNLGGAYRYISGQAQGRTAVFRLAQGNTTVRVEPRGTLPNEAVSSADLRLDKSFRFGRGSQASLYLDIFNINNQGIATGYTEASGASFGVPSGWATPRTYQVSFRLTF